jgi:hypothetical protein
MQVFVKDAASLAALTRLGIPHENMVGFIGHSAPENLGTILDFLHSRGIKAIVGSSRNIDLLPSPAGSYSRLVESGVDIIEADSAIHAGTEILKLWEKDSSNHY